MAQDRSAVGGAEVDVEQLGTARQGVHQEVRGRAGVAAPVGGQQGGGAGGGQAGVERLPPTRPWPPSAGGTAVAPEGSEGSVAAGPEPGPAEGLTGRAVPAAVSSCPTWAASWSSW